MQTTACACLFELRLGMLSLAKQAAHLAQTAPQPSLLALRWSRRLLCMLLQLQRQSIVLLRQLITARVLGAERILQPRLHSQADREQQ